MKQCPACQRNYEDDTLSFCPSDGAKLSERGAETSAAPVVPNLPVPPPASIQTPPSIPSGFSLPEISVPPATGPSAPPVPSLPVSSPFPSAPQPALPPTQSAPKSASSLLVLIAIPLLILILGGAYWFFAVRKAPPVTATADAPTRPTSAPQVASSPSAPPIDPAPVDEASLKSAIRLADDAEIQALSTLDPAPLSQAYTGEALRAELKKLQDLKEKGLYTQAHLDGQEIQSFQVSPDGTKADVRVLETWSTTFYSTATRQVTESKTGEAAPQIISLVKSNGNWIVYADNPQ